MLNKIKKLNTIMKTKEADIYLFGASVTGKKVKEQLEKIGVDVEAFIDNDSKKNNCLFDGKTIHDFEWMKKNITKRDFIIVSSNKYIPISKQLLEAGFTDFLKYEDGLIDYVYHYDEIILDEIIPKYEKSIQWILNHMTKEGGVSYSSLNLIPYPEVTGYIVPTLIEYGYKKEAKIIVKWLLSIQQEDGGYCGPSGTKQEYVFDTAQILRGLNCFADDKEIGHEICKSIEKACAYLQSQMIDDGRQGYVIQYPNMPDTPEPILLYTLPPMKEAAEILEDHKLAQKVENCLQYYLKHPALFDLKKITHFVVYMIEALIDLGKKEETIDVLNYFKNIIEQKGYVEAKKGVEWICTPGIAQLAICWYKLGDSHTADIAIKWMENIQNPTGGFYGSYGLGAEYLENQEIAWAVKFYLDANKLRIKNHFNDTAKDSGIYPENVDKMDPRYQYLKRYIVSGMKIAEIGCGKGRFLKNLHEDYEDLMLVGVDISEEMLKYLPEYVDGRVGELENTRLEDNYYDVVFCIEALEHAVNQKGALLEMRRILKDNGKLIIIDKNKKYWGRMECPSWEQWFDENQLLECMRKMLQDTEFEALQNGNDAQDNLICAWSGRK